MKKIILILFITLFANMLFANCSFQIHTITPVNGCNKDDGIYSFVTLSGPNYYSEGYTDESGYITFYNIPNDDGYTITAVCPAYSEVSQKIGYPCPHTFITICYQNPGRPENSFQLYQNYPNPFNPTTNIKYSNPSANIVKLVIYDILGKEVSGKMKLCS